MCRRECQRTRSSSRLRNRAAGCTTVGCTDRNLPGNSRTTRRRRRPCLRTPELAPPHHPTRRSQRRRRCRRHPFRPGVRRGPWLAGQRSSQQQTRIETPRSRLASSPDGGASVASSRRVRCTNSARPDGSQSGSVACGFVGWEAAHLQLTSATAPRFASIVGYSTKAVRRLGGAPCFGHGRCGAPGREL